jgi:hypothetical protein
MKLYHFHQIQFQSQFEVPFSKHSTFSVLPLKLDVSLSNAVNFSSLDVY